MLRLPFHGWGNTFLNLLNFGAGNGSRSGVFFACPIERAAVFGVKQLLKHGDLHQKVIFQRNRHGFKFLVDFQFRTGENQIVVGINFFHTI